MVRRDGRGASHATGELLAWLPILGRWHPQSGTPEQLSRWPRLTRGRRCHLGGTLSQVTVVRRALKTKTVESAVRATSLPRATPCLQCVGCVCWRRRPRARQRINAPWLGRISVAPPPLAAHPDSGLAVGLGERR
jgi:hypothetical protein